MADLDRVISALEQAKAKLADARNHTFKGAGALSKLRDQVQSALGRSGAHNPAIGKMRIAEQAIKDRAVEINALSARIDRAIAEARAAGGTGAARKAGQAEKSGGAAPA